LLGLGGRGGQAGAEQAASAGPITVDAIELEAAVSELLAPFEHADGESAYELHRDLQETMQNYVGIFRSEEDLKRGLNEIQNLKRRAANVRVEGSRLFNPGWHLARDLKSMLTVSEAVALSALARKESRGAHSRIDFPNYDEGWSKLNNIVSRDGEEMRLSQTTIAEMPSDLRAILDAKSLIDSVSSVPP